MIKSTISLALIIFICALVSCTKDLLPNPATVVGNNGQNVLYDENFDEVTPPALPSGWTGTANGWASNFNIADISSGYPGASGINNLEISNPSTGSPATYLVTTRGVSTIGYSNITAIWGARNSSHFSDSGSAIQSFQWSSDKSNWNNVTYLQNANNSIWAQVDGGFPMSMPGAAGQDSIWFRWTAYVVATPSGSYRLDDFVVSGTPNQ